MAIDGDAVSGRNCNGHTRQEKKLTFGEHGHTTVNVLADVRLNVSETAADCMEHAALVVCQRVDPRGTATTHGVAG